ncbi:MAG TPA: hypothetical protein VHO70_19850 [Chitinispirillaceae bacterium]|nr:hypothetical protein [Chitinispirillaceae bacterium]
MKEFTVYLKGADKIMPVIVRAENYEFCRENIPCGTFRFNPDVAIFSAADVAGIRVNTD